MAAFSRLGGGRVSYGTGFMASPRLMMTNHHVLRSVEDASLSSVEFDYQQDRFGALLPVQTFTLDPAAFFLNDRALDFALVAVRPFTQKDQPLSPYGFIPLIKTEGKILKGEPINIIQHPLGQTKQVVIRNNRLTNLLEKVAHYEADTQPGSSGSPVFNDQWEMIRRLWVGVHADAVRRPEGRPATYVPAPRRNGLSSFPLMARVGSD